MFKVKNSYKTGIYLSQINSKRQCQMQPTVCGATVDRNNDAIIFYAVKLPVAKVKQQGKKSLANMALNWNVSYPVLRILHLSLVKPHSNLLNTVRWEYMTHTTSL